MGEISNLKKLLLVSALIATAICRTAAGKVIYVDDDGPADFNNIQAAIDVANDGDVIEVQPGTYTGDGNRDIDFLSKAVTVRGTTGDANDCIIDCQGTEAEPHRGFKFVSGEDSNSVLEDFTITNGYAPEEYFSLFMYSIGGAIHCNSSSPTINNCIIVYNTAADHGGGIWNDNSSPIISNCTISDHKKLHYQR